MFTCLCCTVAKPSNCFPVDRGKRAHVRGHKPTCKDCIKKKYYANHEESKTQRVRSYHKTKEKRLAYQQRRKKENPSYFAALEAKRRASKKNATPSWSDLEEIENIYKEAHYFQLHVDHIVPLQHDRVCGLHVPDNLQLLTREENGKKSNTFTVGG